MLVCTGGSPVLAAAQPSRLCYMVRYGNYTSTAADRRTAA